MAYKSKNLVLPFTGTFLIFIVSFFVSLIILGETNVFGTQNPENSPEPMTYAGGIIGYSLLIAIFIGLITFYLFYLKYDLQTYIYLILVILLGILTIILSYVVLRLIFDITSLFVLIRFPTFVTYTNNCLNDESCIREVYGLQYALILSTIIGVISSLGFYILFRKKNKFQSV